MYGQSNCEALVSRTDCQGAFDGWRGQSVTKSSLSSCNYEHVLLVVGPTKCSAAREMDRQLGYALETTHINLKGNIVIYLHKLTRNNI